MQRPYAIGRWCAGLVAALILAACSLPGREDSQGSSLDVDASFGGTLKRAFERTMAEPVAEVSFEIGAEEKEKGLSGTGTMSLEDALFEVEVEFPELATALRMPDDRASLHLIFAGDLLYLEVPGLERSVRGKSWVRFESLQAGPLSDVNLSSLLAFGDGGLLQLLELGIDPTSVTDQGDERGMAKYTALWELEEASAAAATEGALYPDDVEVVVSSQDEEIETLVHEGYLRRISFTSRTSSSPERTIESRFEEFPPNASIRRPDRSQVIGAAELARMIRARRA